jgi:hypothetical protein
VLWSVLIAIHDATEAQGAAVITYVCSFLVEGPGQASMREEASVNLRSYARRTSSSNMCNVIPWERLTRLAAIHVMKGF